MPTQGLIIQNDGTSNAILIDKNYQLYHFFDPEGKLNNFSKINLFKISFSENQDLTPEDLIFVEFDLMDYNISYGEENFTEKFAVITNVISDKELIKELKKEFSEVLEMIGFGETIEQTARVRDVRMDDDVNPKQKGLIEVLLPSNDPNETDTIKIYEFKENPISNNCPKLTNGDMVNFKHSLAFRVGKAKNVCKI